MNLVSISMHFTLWIWSISNGIVFSMILTFSTFSKTLITLRWLVFQFGNFCSQTHSQYQELSKVFSKESNEMTLSSKKKVHASITWVEKKLNLLDLIWTPNVDFFKKTLSCNEIPYSFIICYWKSYDSIAGEVRRQVFWTQLVSQVF